jgi:hypothetical protein
VLLALALAAGAAGYLVKIGAAGLHRVLLAAIVCGVFGLVYLGAARMTRIPEAAALFDRIRRFTRRV